ncbi:MAG: TIR domain-containing protein [Alphaproteobacteria bacterium]|nr:TIR domain-containing protein [Alphaproteobacteria bacterium]
MADVFICYSREDRDRVRPIAEGLEAEGWNVWWAPSGSPQGENEDADRELSSAGAILVVWSAASRASEYVRSEAATGLYKNKLIQTRIDHASPPRPFDQVEVMDLGLWSGERNDPNWRAVVSAVRHYARAPGSERPQVMRRAAAAPPEDRPPPRRGSRSREEAVSYLEPSRTLAPGPIIFGVVVLALLGGVWLIDPFNWHTPPRAGGDHAGKTVVATAASPAPAKPASPETIAASETAWAVVNRSSPEELRAFLARYPGTGAADSARSLLRVLDAQAWADAVLADTETAYTAYLHDFPPDAVIPGAMAAAANDRLSSLASERAQAITDIQQGLTALGLYKGKADGQPGAATIRAAGAFARRYKRSLPDMKTAAPRDLRSFGDLVSSAAGGQASAAAVSAPSGASSSAPAAATPSPAASTPPKPQAAPPASAPASPPASPGAAAAAEADRERLRQAQAASRAAQQSAAAIAADAAPSTEEDKRLSQDVTDWTSARAANTVAAYQLYLHDHPDGGFIANARTAMDQLAKPAAYSLAQLAPQVRQAVEAAREAQSTAQARAASARATAGRADAVAAAAETGAVGTQILTSASGDRYESQVSGGAPNGLGVKVIGAGVAVGDHYRGELRNGLGAGLGVYEFADNSNNAQAGALRYEGEHAADQANGYGVTYWKNGDRFAGQQNASRVGRGVLTFANGQRYEGEMSDGRRNGYGVVWSADGAVMMAGRFQNGTLAEPSP